jgi:hypothetical protein
VTTAAAIEAGEAIVLLDYAAGTQISRVNKGLRRRRSKSILGFWINTSTGRWSKGEDEDEDEERDPESPLIQRVVPIVQDNKNAALIRFDGYRPSEITSATLQHALLGGIELTFQLEEGETATEPVPSRDRRNAILIYEGTEGGAGVLSRLVQEPKLAEVARAALELMHYKNIDAAIASRQPALLESDQDAHCVKGCYRCLLSYYNQPDHELIDRTNPDACMLLLRLAGATVERRERQAAQVADTDGWLKAIEEWHLPPPSNESIIVDGLTVTLAWREHYVVAVPADFPPGLIAKLEAMAFTVCRLPQDVPLEAPPELVAVLGDLV